VLELDCIIAKFVSKVGGIGVGLYQLGLCQRLEVLELDCVVKFGCVKGWRYWSWSWNSDITLLRQFWPWQI